SVASAKSSVTPLPVRTGTKCDHSGPASNPRMSARNLADLHLSLAGMMVWLSSIVIRSPLARVRPLVSRKWSRPLDGASSVARIAHALRQRRLSRLCWNRHRSGQRHPPGDGDIEMAIDIAEWLRGLGLAQYSEAFAENAINWEVLSKLTGDDL